MATLITARSFEPAHFRIMALINAASSILGVIDFSHFPNRNFVNAETNNQHIKKEVKELY